MTYAPNTHRLYPKNHETGPNTLVCFDTDYTMDYARGPVPLPHVLRLRAKPDVSVWATGSNQSLRNQAAIPGVREINVLRGAKQRELLERTRRLRELARLYPDADTYVVVDDCNLRMLDEWEYYPPGAYVNEYFTWDTDEVTEPRFTPRSLG